MRGTGYVCSSCGTRAPRWQGRCGGCAEWNTLEASPTAPRAGLVLDAATQRLDGVDPEGAARRPTGVAELDRVLGGGLVAGSTTLLFGEPGVGKSTLALTALLAVAARGESVLLVAAEESAGQVAGRARRLGPVPEGVEVTTTTLAPAAAALIAQRAPVVCVVDSVSAMSDDGLPSATGSVPQVRQAAERLCAVAKAQGTALVLVGHVTKDGDLAGPRALEHLVDTVVRVEGDRHGPLRVVRALKHRFGATGEVGLFEMGEAGLVEVADVAALAGPRLSVPGVVRTITNDGSRAFPVDVQVLVARSAAGPRRVAYQVSAARLSLLLAVLEARCGIDLGPHDVFAAAAGGLPASEPAVDLALALAVASAATGAALDPDLVALGEVGLAGELRAVGGLERRVREARRRGAGVILAPDQDGAGVDPGAVRPCRSLAEALGAAGLAPVRRRPSSATMVNPPNAPS
ncbi:MAG TPA: ATPase domain-containing protein [Acidimicrobiales bacterium]|nr:ATPase domain-containing protein [Acidimicrobiales bacterium]